MIVNYFCYIGSFVICSLGPWRWSWIYEPSKRPFYKT